MSAVFTAAKPSSAGTSGLVLLLTALINDASWTFSGTDADGKHITYRGVDLFDFDGDLISLKDAYRKERSRPIGA